MKIGISTSVIQRGKTGIAQHLFGLLRGFFAHERTPEIVLFVLEEDVPLFSFAAGSVEIVPVEERFRPPIRNILWHQQVLPCLAEEHRLDVLHVPSYRRMLWPRPCPLVASIHDLAPFHVQGKYDIARMFYGRVVVKQLAQRQDRIIAISESTAQDVRRFFRVPSDRITVIHNGIDHTRFHAGSTEQAKAFMAERHSISEPFFLYVARLEHPAKNHVRLIQAFEQFKKHNAQHWSLVFGGSDWHGAEVIHQAIRKSPVRADIHSLGFIPDEDLSKLYRAAGALVYPSLFEGFGLPPVEAMACGCPVISSTCGSLGEVIGTAAAIVNPEDVSDIANAMKRMADDENYRESLRRAGLEQARQFDWRITATKTLRVYEDAFKTLDWSPHHVRPKAKAM